MKLVVVFLVVVALGAEARSEEKPSAKELDALLQENTRQLHRAFEAKDEKLEAKLYEERSQILLRRRDLRPKSKEEPQVHRGLVERKSRSSISLDSTGPQPSVSIRLGEIPPAVRGPYEAIRPGDHVELIFTHEPDLYDDKGYHYELTGVRQLEGSKHHILLLTQDDFYDEHTTLSQVLGAKEGSVTFVATVRNTGDQALPFRVDRGLKISVQGWPGPVDCPFVATATTTSIPPGSVGVMQIDVSKVPKDAESLGVRLQRPDNLSIINAIVPVRTR